MSKITIIEGNSNDKDNVRVIMVKGERGYGITSIEKTSSTGLIDTYTITYEDGTTSTFTITNGEMTKESTINIYGTVADMKADTSIRNNTCCKTLGYYSVNDGGCADYKISNDDMLIDDGGSVHNLQNGLKAVLLVENQVNVLQFGAKGDGTTDDTTAFQNASDFAQSNNLNFYVPNKNFLIQDVTIENIKIVKIDGEITLKTSSNNLNIYENVNNGVTPHIYINKVTVGNIVMKGLNSADITVQNANKLILLADDTTNHNFIAYNKFYLGFIRNLLITNTNGNNWINENLFFGGRFLAITFDGTYPHQNNLFLKPMCEHTDITFNVGVQNRILDARLEGNCSITFGEDTAENIVTQNYSGTLQEAYKPKLYQDIISVVDYSDGKNQVIKNENLIEHNVLNLNKFNNPKSATILNDGFSTETEQLLFESDLIEVPDIITGLYIYLDNVNFWFRLECYDENKQKLQTTDMNLLRNSPTLSITSNGTYGNTVANRLDYWAIIKPHNELIKYFKIKFYTNATSNTTDIIKSIQLFLTHYSKLKNEGYYLEGLSKSI